MCAGAGVRPSRASPGSLCITYQCDWLAEHVALATHSLDIRLFACSVAQALPQPTDEQIDGAIEYFRIAALRQVEQLVAAEHALRMIDENAQQAEFGAAERIGGTVLAQQVACGGIQPPFAEANQDASALLDVYQWIGRDGMARAYKAAVPLRPPYGSPLSAACRQVFVDQAPEALKVQVADKIARITF